MTELAINTVQTPIDRAWKNIRKMIEDRNIKPCPRMNTDSCTHSEFPPFPNPKQNPLNYDITILLRCEKCIYSWRTHQ